MYKEFFDIENGELIINEHILAIPCLRAVKDRYEDPMPALKFLRYRFDPKGPYADEEELEKNDILLEEFPGEYTLEDPEMITAIEWFESRITPTYRYYLDCKILMEKLGKYGRNAVVDSSRDGNLAALQRQMGGVGKTIREFRELEKVVEQELEEMKKSKNRGSVESSYEEDQ